MKMMFAIKPFDCNDKIIILKKKNRRVFLDDDSVYKIFKYTFKDLYRPKRISSYYEFQGNKLAIKELVLAPKLKRIVIRPFSRSVIHQYERLKSGEFLDVTIEKTGIDKELLETVFDGIASLAKKNLYHGDLNPGNIFISDSGEFYVIDLEVFTKSKCDKSILYYLMCSTFVNAYINSKMGGEVFYRTMQSVAEKEFTLCHEKGPLLYKFFIGSKMSKKLRNYKAGIVKGKNGFELIQ